MERCSHLELEHQDRELRNLQVVPFRALPGVHGKPLGVLPAGLGRLQPPLPQPLHHKVGGVQEHVSAML